MANFAFVFLFTLYLKVGDAFEPGLLDDASNSEVNAVKIRLTEEKSKRLLLQNDVESLMMRIEELERTITELKITTPMTNPKHSETKVYFNVKLSKKTALDSLHVVVFDTILDNVGDAYSHVTGIFRAPVPGLYQFSISVLSPGKNEYVHIQLMRNGDELGRLFAGDIVAQYGQMGSFTIPILLAEGDEVYIQEMETVAGHLHGGNYCSFSGVLLSR